MKFARLCLLVVSFCIPIERGTAKEPLKMSVPHLKNILRQQGFSGSLKGDVRFKDLGAVGCGKARYRVFYFNWAEVRPGGNPGHGLQRLLFIGPGDRYAGSFEVEDPPLRVKGNVI